MNPQNNLPAPETAEPNYDELVDRVGYDFGLKRRSFVQLLGAGLLIAASAPALAQRRGGGRGFGGSGAKDFQQAVPAEVQLTPVKEWKVMGASKPRPNGRDVVTGVHKYPSDISRPGMLYGKILRAPAYGSQLTDIDLGPAKALPGVVVV